MAGESGWKKIRATFTVLSGLCASNPDMRIEVSVARSTAQAMNAPLRKKMPGGVFSEAPKESR
jgi:hypothetical protein